MKEAELRRDAQAARDRARLFREFADAEDRRAARLEQEAAAVKPLCDWWGSPFCQCSRCSARRISERA